MLPRTLATVFHRGSLSGAQLRYLAKRSDAGSASSREIISLEEFLDVKPVAARMQEQLMNLRQHCDRLSVGRANPRLLDSVKIQLKTQAAGKSLTEFGRVTVRDTNTLTVTLNSPDNAKIVSAAIVSANLGLNPQIESPTVLKVPIPRPSTDAREALARGLKKTGEEYKKVLRDVYSKETKAVTRGSFGGLSQDHKKRRLKSLEDLTKKMSKEVDDVVSAKCKEIRD